MTKDFSPVNLNTIPFAFIHVLENTFLHLFTPLRVSQNPSIFSNIKAKACLKAPFDDEDKNVYRFCYFKFPC